ncbi:Thymidylate synthase ThyX [uncultured archaeon]|nr:Thymidylate synthase ThyX [uncultured archaeon]
MKIIEPSFRLSMLHTAGMGYNDGVKMLRYIEEQGRISHRSEDKQSLDSWQKFIPAVVMGHGDWSITEHVSVTATIRASRGVLNELVRHRLASYTQESTRFVRYDSFDHSRQQFEFIMPERLKEDYRSIFFFEEHCKASEAAYNALIDRGSRPQEARDVLPLSFASTIAMTTNLRNWRLFFLMRTTKETLPEFKRISVPMLREFQRVIPFLYDDITPDARQVENLGKAR